MTQSLAALLSHAERLRDDTVAEMALAEGNLRQLQLQQEQLVAYRDEYRQRNPAQGGRSTSIEMLRVHQGFMGRLDQALTQLQGQLAHAQGRLDATRQVLLAQETRVASVKKLLERRHMQHAVASARQEQRQSDEAAMRRRRDDRHGHPGWRIGTEHAPLAH